MRARPHATGSGALLAAAPSPIAVAHWVHGAALWRSWILIAGCAAASLALLVAGAVLPRRPSVARPLATGGALGILGLGARYLATAPATTLAVLLVATGGVALLWSPAGAAMRRRHMRIEGRAQGAAVVALAFWLVVALSAGTPAPLEVAAVAASFAIAGALGITWAVAARARHPARAAVTTLAFAVVTALAFVLRGDWWPATSAGALMSAAVALALPHPPRADGDRFGWWGLLGHPERLFVGTFATLSAVGTVLLALPPSAADGRGLAFLDAAFTAVSAVCVTGLIVVDTPVDLSAFGQVVVLALIQLGGLGIMTFSTAAMSLLGRRMGLRLEGAVASLISPRDRGSFLGAARRILAFTFAVEAIGALALLAAFLAAGDDLERGAWRAVFTSISAFCNAGFALQTDSLIPYQGDPAILYTVSALIVLGGLSPAAALAVPVLAGRSVRPVPAQAKLILASTAILLVSGAVLFLAFEWNDSLAGMSVADRIHNAWFQSATLRTAGFNSIDMSSLRPATLTLMLGWMFIGGSPGGTAGGIKTTTAATLVLAVTSAIAGHYSVIVYKRQIPARTVVKAAVVATLGVAMVGVAIVAILLTQAMPTDAAVFEVVSALGTVGLSIGGTGQLDGVGKGIIMACMFVGRVGTLTLLMFLSQRVAPRRLDRPEEEIDVG